MESSNNLAIDELTREELFYGIFAGRHVVTGTPVTGFKKVKSCCNPNNGDRFLCSETILEVEVPVGETIIKPAICYWGPSMKCGAENYLRASKVVTKGIVYQEDRKRFRTLTPKPDIEQNTCALLSQWDNMFRYNVGKVQTPTEPFDGNPYNALSSGIHFVLSHKDALKQ